MENGSALLSGLSILIVEDEMMVAMMLEDSLKDFGCSVCVAGTVEEALALIGKTQLDGALLDMNLHGRPTIPIAEDLARRSVPFLFVTGYSEREADPPLIKAAPRLHKPFTEKDLARRMTQVFVPDLPAASALYHRRGP